jgi:hypothetical protein
MNLSIILNMQLKAFKILPVALKIRKILFINPVRGKMLELFTDFLIIYLGTDRYTGIFAYSMTLRFKRKNRITVQY